MYLDPGFGSMLIQIIIAAIAAGGAYLILFKKSIVGLFKKRGQAGQRAETPQDEGGTRK